MRARFATGTGGNGIANAVASPDCASGCEVVVEQDYGGEGYNPLQWNSKTHLKDERGGGEANTYLNPSSSGGITAAGQTNTTVSTQSAVSLFQENGNQEPASVALVINHQGVTGGSNLFPENIDVPVPYFKMTYGALQLNGAYNTTGQHVLDQQTTHCYGVGDCLMGARFMFASGGFRDNADEGAHPYDLQTFEDSAVFEGACASGCTPGSTALQISVTASGGTQGDGRFLIDTNPSKVIGSASGGGAVIGGGNASPHALANFSGTAFPVSVFLTTSAPIVSQANNLAPGTVTIAIATSGVHSGFATNTAAIGATSGVACLADQDMKYAAHNYEMAPYSVVDGTHLQLTLNKPHANPATIAFGGLCGYGLEQTVDTASGIRQVFPVVGSLSATSLYYAAGQTPIVGTQGLTSGYINVNVPLASLARSGNVVTVTTSGNLPADVNGLTLTIAGVVDSSYSGNFTVTTTGSNTFTYSQTGANSTSTGGSASILTGGFKLYPMAEVLSVFNPATKAVDGYMSLAPNTVAWAASDTVEQPHYYQELIVADTQLFGQVTPRPDGSQVGGIQYSGNNGPGITGWTINDASPVTNYIGYGGTHSPPDAAYAASGVWSRTMSLTAGEHSVFDIHCNLHGCGNWNSGYLLFNFDTAGGNSNISFSPRTNVMTIQMNGTPYTFAPGAFSANTINVGTLNATTITGGVTGSSIISGTIDAARLPLFGGSGGSHGAGAVPDPGTTAGTSRFLREDGTWSVPSGDGSAGIGSSGAITSGTIDGTVIGGTTPAAVTATTLNGVAVGEYANVPRKPMATLLEALHNAKNQPVNILVAGDSFSICERTMCNSGPVTSSNVWATQLRVALQAQYGSHGTGMVPLISQVIPSLNTEQWTVSGSLSVVNQPYGPNQTGNGASGSLVNLSNGQVATFTSSIPYDTINAYCLTTPGTGSIAVAIDGVPAGTACGTETPGAAYSVSTSSPVALGVHTTTFTSSGSTYLYAAEGTAGTSGVSVHNISVGGASAEWLGANTAIQMAFTDLIPTGTQGAIVMFQTNEPGDGFSVASFTSAMNAIITHELSLPGTPSVMVAVPPQDIVNGLAPYAAAQVALAQTLPVALVNIQDRWGTAYNASSGLWDTGAAGPGIHPNDKGSLDEFSMIYAALTDGAPVNAIVSGPGSAPASSSAGNCPAAQGMWHDDTYFYACTSSGIKRVALGSF